MYLLILGEVKATQKAIFDIVQQVAMEGVGWPLSLQLINTQ